MKRLATIALTTAFASLTAVAASAGSLNGTKWQSIDDKTGEKKAVIQFSGTSSVSGKIIRVNDRSKANEVCDKCPGSLRGKKIEGLRIISGLKPQGNNVWDGGKLIDPESGRTYKGKVTMSSNGQTLKLRGYVGVAALGRSQTWKRIN